MSQRPEVPNKFELVILAGARARQLMRGSTPRAEGSLKPARIAALEITQGHVRKVQTPVGE